MSGEEFLFKFCGQSDEICTRCWIASLSLSLFYKSCMSLYDKQKLNKKPKLRTDQILKTDSSNCFFYNASKQDKELNLCQTLYPDMKIRKIDLKISIDKLLRKLTVGYMVATGAKYHCIYLLKFYNSYQKHNNKRNQAKEQLMEGIAFSKVLEFIEESILASDEAATPVLYLKELTGTYKKHLIVQEATETANSVHQ